MGVLYYYEYLLIKKLKEGVVLHEEPLKCRNDVCVYEGSNNNSEDKVPNYTMLIIINNERSVKRTGKKLACCQLQLGWPWYKDIKILLDKYDHFSSDESLIVYNKNDYKVRFRRISFELKFMEVALDQHPRRLLLFLNNELRSLKDSEISGDAVFSHYVSQNNIVEMHLDSICLQREVILPPELFRCSNVKVLSLKNNYMTSISADIGRMVNLEQLILTNNLLTVKSIPRTLSFCSQLTHLYLDNNHFDALPGFLLDMPNLLCVRRHGNHNYFKSTFIWYHHEYNERVLKISSDGKKLVQTSFDPSRLEILAVQSVISSRENFFTPGYLPEILQDYISRVFTDFNICGNCSIAKPSSELGYKVFIFKSPYLGNTCVPFQHWACSHECGRAIEVPARLAQQRAYRKMDELYERHISMIQSDSRNLPPDKSPSCTLF